MASRRVLMAADDADQVMLFSLILTRAGYQVTAVTDGAAALRQLEHGHFEIFLTDYYLPDMHGSALIAAARQAGNSCKMVLMSNSCYVCELAHASHADGCFDKNDPLRLPALLDRALDRHAVLA